ncbi:hypothetical protein VB711_23755 [Cronbergia sp. UHCC 0137]|uniref:hypothetical protein n=1 Tax=Cronbergia sp. UHCC 0137 TaxID=3110239 RepID=UPI002B21147D|nr:hypothetical protein [Cronbergia sp. UHCC 0137]MEA5620831.1 hypothetical protein [Cronbergia sp. UHCC 0137]
MVNQQETNSTVQLDNFTEALAEARRMQQNWLEYGLNFVHVYVEDVDGDWLETWGDDEILGNPLLDPVKEFLVSDDDVAIRIRHYLGESSLFDLAVNLEECLRISKEEDRLSGVKTVLQRNCHIDDLELTSLANHLIKNLL